MAGLHALVAFLLSFLLVAASTPLIRRCALQWKLGDKPNGRKIHTSTIPHLGGIGMVIGSLGSLGLLIAFYSGVNGEVPRILLKVLVPVGMIVTLGLTDDTKNLRAHQKLTVQTIASFIIAVSGIHLLVGLPAFDSHLLFVILLTAFYLVGVSSSVNLIDGHDGLAAGIVFISACAFGVTGLVLESAALVCVSLTVAGACLGFLIYNFPPGRIFMGDTGSLFLGIMLGILACSFTMLQPNINTFFGVCLILSVPMLDSWLAIARRLTLRRPVFEADCMHIHHVLGTFGFSPRQTLVILYSMQAVLAALGILAVMGFVFPIVTGLGILLVAFSTFYRMMVASKMRLGERPSEFPRGSVPSLEK
ncbi:MAG: undecaprenyl/decaprenyl-phosphate alpha-N-acetylglucosaminyl 1-phosphate transferase [Candidatus Latescibacterota bacterium]|nr:MAG: undecaprenyl/decaprenyl-phosphate alpha-N-acetylglucosaminyl 1-phosphate transferase [Candidatus Latescibacterota bacterium]